MVICHLTITVVTCTTSLLSLPTSDSNCQTAGIQTVILRLAPSEAWLISVLDTTPNTDENPSNTIPESLKPYTQLADTSSSCLTTFAVLHLSKNLLFFFVLLKLGVTGIMQCRKLLTAVDIQWCGSPQCCKTVNVTTTDSVSSSAIYLNAKLALIETWSEGNTPVGRPGSISFESTAFSMPSTSSDTFENQM